MGIVCCLVPVAMLEYRKIRPYLHGIPHVVKEGGGSYFVRAMCM